MAGKYPSREQDDETLLIVGLRASGLSTRQIAARVGLTQQTVMEKTNKVRAADMAESGDRAGAVRAGYWE